MYSSVLRIAVALLVARKTKIGCTRVIVDFSSAAAAANRRRLTRAAACARVAGRRRRLDRSSALLRRRDRRAIRKPPIAAAADDDDDDDDDHGAARSHVSDPRARRVGAAVALLDVRSRRPNSHRHLHDHQLPHAAQQRRRHGALGARLAAAHPRLARFVCSRPAFARIFFSARSRRATRLMSAFLYLHLHFHISQAKIAGRRAARRMP